MDVRFVVKVSFCLIEYLFVYYLGFAIYVHFIYISPVYNANDGITARPSGATSLSYSPESAYFPNIIKPIEATGVIMSIIINPKIKSSCLPVMVLGSPNLKTPK